MLGGEFVPVGGDSFVGVWHDFLENWTKISSSSWWITTDRKMMFTWTFPQISNTSFTSLLGGLVLRPLCIWYFAHLFLTDIGWNCCRSCFRSSTHLYHGNRTNNKLKSKAYDLLGMLARFGIAHRIHFRVISAIRICVRCRYIDIVCVLYDVPLYARESLLLPEKGQHAKLWKIFALVPWYPQHRRPQQSRIRTWADPNQEQCKRKGANDRDRHVNVPISASFNRQPCSGCMFSTGWYLHHFTLRLCHCDIGRSSQIVDWHLHYDFSSCSFNWYNSGEVHQWFRQSQGKEVADHSRLIPINDFHPTDFVICDILDLRLVSFVGIGILELWPWLGARWRSGEMDNASSSGYTRALR